MAADFLLLLATGASAQSNVGPTPAPRPRLTEELRRAADRASGQNGYVVANPSTSDSDAVKMAPYVVSDTPLLIYRKPKGTDPEDHPFTWADGGTILSHTGNTFTTEVKFQYDPQHKKFNLLKISW